MSELKLKELQLTPESEKAWHKLLEQYPDKVSALLPLLRIIEKQEDGIDDAGIALAAKLTGLQESKVLGVVTFYTHFKRGTDGKHVIYFCCTLSCAINGAFDVVEHVKAKLGINVGETTSDGKFTLKKVECLGACGYAPVIQIDDDYYLNMTATKLDEIIAKLSKA